MCLSRVLNSLILVDVKSVARIEPLPLLNLIVLTMDAKLLGLRSARDSHSTEDLNFEGSSNSNQHLGTEQFLILLWSDNAKAMAYINHQGGTRCCAVQKTAYYPTSFSWMKDNLGAKNTCHTNCYIKYIVYTQLQIQIDDLVIILISPEHYT